MERLQCVRPEDSNWDDLHGRIENAQLECAFECLKNGIDVILENGFWAEEERYLYAVSALQVGARIELVYLEAPFEVLWERLKLRSEKATLITISKEALESYSAQFQPPNEEEGAFYDEISVLSAKDDCL